jgi:membrane-associated phospholipid phosphatase
VLVRLWVVTVLFAGVAVARSVRIGIPVRDPGGEFFVTRLAMSAAIFVGLVALEALVRAPRHPWSWVRRTWTPARLGVVWAALLAYHVVYLTYHNLKSWNVLNAPRDAGLTRVDEWLFAGHSPAVLLHDLLGQGIADRVLVVWYQAFGTLSVVAIVAVVVVRPAREALTAVCAGAWVWILGTATYYLVPSLGPFHQRPQDFAGLPHSVVTDSQARLIAQRAHLLAHPQAHDAFAQVAAFASLHVGVTTVVTLMAARLGFRRTAWVLRVFLAGTCVATVYLGWHFFVDVPAGLAIGWLAVRLSGAAGAPRSEPRPDRAPARSRRRRSPRPGARSPAPAPRRPSPG